MRKYLERVGATPFRLIIALDNELDSRLYKVD